MKQISRKIFLVNNLLTFEKINEFSKSIVKISSRCWNPRKNIFVFERLFLIIQIEIKKFRWKISKKAADSRHFEWNNISYQQKLKPPIILEKPTWKFSRIHQKFKQWFVIIFIHVFSHISIFFTCFSS
jgi:hypothetical protein